VDKVYAIANKDGKREVKVLASGLYRPNGVAYKDGTLYIAELSKISKIAKGVRNTVGFDWNPETKQLYFTDNGRDWMSEDVPEDELNRVTKVGEHFGAPYCLQGNIVDPEFGWGKSCSEFTAPVGLLGPHSAALGMRFYTGSMFPKAYKNVAIIARHGSWNRSKKV